MIYGDGEAAAILHVLIENPTRTGELVEQEAREAGTVSRNQNVVYVMPHDWASIAQFLGPLLERIDESSNEIQLLVLTPDAEVAGAVSASAVKLLEGRDVSIVAATSAGRASRLAKIRPPQVLAGAPSTIVEMLRGAAIKVESLKAVCLAWADELIARDESAPLEAVMTEVPKDAARIIVASETTADVDALVERYARRARRVAPAAGEGQPTALEYITASANSRLSSLRRVLDDLDPKSATIFVRDRDRLAEVNDLLRAIGYGSDAGVRVGVAATPEDELVVLYDLPASREELREAVGSARRSIALVQPRQLPSLRALAAGGAVRPRALPESGQRARDFDAKVRTELRSVLEEGKFGRALLAIEQLLDDFDGSEIAAAALVLLERERETIRAALAAVPVGQRPAGEMTRLFVSVGARDGVRPGDLVGALSNQGGISSTELGRVDIRESHSVVEASSAVADTLIEKVTGTTIKGRRAIVRRDEQPARPERGERGDRPERGERGGPRGGPRGASRGGPPRGGDRGERSDRGGPRSGPRGPRRDDGDRRPPRSGPRREGRRDAE